MLFTEKLTELAQISGITASISLLIGFILGFVVLMRAIKSKEKMIFLFFLCIIFTLSPWYPSGGGYVYWLITGKSLSYEWYIIIGLTGVPIAIISWLIVYTTTIKPESRTLVISIYLIISIIYEIYVYYNLFFAVGAPVKELIGIFSHKDNFIDIDYKSFVLFYLALSILTSVITGIHFSLVSIKAGDNPTIIWKGKFLLIAFPLFGISAIFDAIITMTPILLVIIRFCLMATTFFFYLGFILPKWAKRILSIED
ncbi:MAG: hypothetical protein ACTSVV_14130 [Promethearchaeota archaeon]